MVVSLERGADLHMAQLMPLPLTVSCFSKIQIGLTFLVPAHLGSPRKRAVKWVRVYTDIAVRSLTCHTTVCVTLPNQSQRSRSSATANDVLSAIRRTAESGMRKPAATLQLSPQWCFRVCRCGFDQQIYRHQQTLVTTVTTSYILHFAQPPYMPYLTLIFF